VSASGGNEVDVPGFRLVRRLPTRLGGSGDLYLAVRDSDRRQVAVRMFRRTLPDRRAHLRFEGEIDALRVLAREPHLAEIFEAGCRDTGRPYVIMQFCPDGSLADHLNMVGRLTPHEVVSVGVKLAGALARLHRHKIVHRNITPSNVLMALDGEPVLADFGLLSLATADRTFAAPPAPPGRFAAPEAFLPELMTPAADIYSLGAVLHALLSGDADRAWRPLAGGALPDVPGAPDALVRPLRRATAVEPRDRFAAAEDLVDALATARLAIPPLVGDLP
jgi:serine/threonine protein kinase